MILFNALNEELGRYNSELAAKEKSEKAFGARIDKQSIQRCLTEDNMGLRVLGQID